MCVIPVDYGLHALRLTVSGGGLNPPTQNTQERMESWFRVCRPNCPSKDLHHSLGRQCLPSNAHPWSMELAQYLAACT